MKKINNLAYGGLSIKVQFALQVKKVPAYYTCLLPHTISTKPFPPHNHYPYGRVYHDSQGSPGDLD